MNKVCETRLLIEDLTFTSEILSCAASWGTEVARHYSNFVETRTNDSDKAIVHSLYLLLRYAFLLGNKGNILGQETVNVALMTEKVPTD